LTDKQLTTSFTGQPGYAGSRMVSYLFLILMKHLMTGW